MSIKYEWCNQMFEHKVDYKIKEVFGDHLTHYSFYIEDNEYIIDVINSKNSDYLRVSFTLSGKGTGIYNTGNAFKVFSVVFNILKEIMFITGKHKLSFASSIKLKSRLKLYDRFCSTMVNKKKALNWSFEDDSKYREYEISF